MKLKRLRVVRRKRAVAAVRAGWGRWGGVGIELGEG
jgi:hypothetical protein